MSAYHMLLFVHVAAAIAWVGAATMQALLGVRVVRAGDPTRTLAFAREGHWTGLHVYLPANLLVLASGLLLVYVGGWSLSTLWIDVGLAGYAISIATGAAALKPRWEAAVRLGDRDLGGLHPLVRRVVFVTHVDLAVLSGVVYAMVVKPSPGDAPELLAGAALVAGVLLLASRALVPGRRAFADARSVPAAVDA